MRVAVFLRVALALSFACGGEAGGDGNGGGDGDGDAPIADAGADKAIWAGLVARLDGSGSELATSFSWAQTGGPPATLIDSDQAVAFASFPASAQIGTATFELTATDPASGESDVDTVTIEVRSESFENFFAVPPPAEQLGTSEGIAFDEQGMWVVTAENNGFVSLFDSTGAFVKRYVVSDSPVGANFLPDGRLAIARSGLGIVSALDTADGALETLAEGLGAANYPLVDKDGNIYVSNRQGGQVMRVDALTGDAREFIADLGPNPNALAWGPESDVIYIGTVGRIWRVPILPDGAAGDPELYIDFGSQDGITDEVDGMVFDEGRNLWFGCPNSRTLRVATYSADGRATVTRAFSDVSPFFSVFVNTSFGTGDFDPTVVYYTNLSNRTVGRFPLGMPALRSPMAVGQ